MDLQDQGSDKSEKAIYQFINTLEDTETSTFLQNISGDADRNLFKIASSDFAIPELRKFPMDSATNSALSLAYLQSQESLLTDDMFEKTATILTDRISLQDSSLLEDLSFATKPIMKKQASNYGYLLPNKHFFKIASSTDISEATILFQKESASLNLADKIEYCSNLIKTSEELGALVTDDTINAYAGCADCDIAEVKVGLSLREGLSIRKGTDGSSFSKLGSSLNSLEEEPSHSELLDLVTVISSMDKTAGFSERDYKKIPDPMLTVFNKSAENTEPKSQENQKLTDKDKENEDLKQMTKAEIIGRFGENILPEIEEPDGKINIDMLKHVKKIFDVHKGEKE